MTAQLTFDSPADVDQWCTNWLKQRGYHVTTPGEWMTPKDLCSRLGITYKALNGIMRRNGCPEVDTDEGPTGRLIRLKVTDDLKRFCLIHKS